MSDLIIDSAIDKFDSIYSIYITIVIVFTGLFLILHDARRLKISNKMREYKIAKYLGFIYIIGGSGLYLITLLI